MSSPGQVLLHWLHRRSTPRRQRTVLNERICHHDHQQPDRQRHECPGISPGQRPGGWPPMSQATWRQDRSHPTVSASEVATESCLVPTSCVERTTNYIADYRAGTLLCGPSLGIRGGRTVQPGNDPLSIEDATAARKGRTVPGLASSRRACRTRL